MEAQTIGRRIAEARKKITTSQAQLAERLFVSQQAVGKWERGESIPDIITFSRLAKILGVDLNYFSDDFPSKTAEPQISETDQPTEAAAERQRPRPNWDMSRGNWVGADFSGLKNLHEKFGSSNMKNCRFIGSDLSGLLLKSNHVDGCDFSDSDFSGSRVRNSYLAGNGFRNCSLTDAGFAGSHITGCDFSGADLTGVTFSGSGFEKITAPGATWNRTSFTGSDLSRIVFDGTLEDCAFENCSFTRVEFRDATLLNTFFKCRSLKRIKFIDCQADRMTYEFLKNGKADLSGITLLAT